MGQVVAQLHAHTAARQRRASPHCPGGGRKARISAHTSWMGAGMFSWPAPLKCSSSPASTCSAHDWPSPTTPVSMEQVGRRGQLELQHHPLGRFYSWGHQQQLPSPQASLALYRLLVGCGWPLWVWLLERRHHLGHARC